MIKSNFKLVGAEKLCAECDENRATLFRIMFRDKANKICVKVKTNFPSYHRSTTNSNVHVNDATALKIKSRSVSSIDRHLIVLRIEKLLAFTQQIEHCNSHQILLAQCYHFPTRLSKLNAREQQSGKYQIVICYKSWGKSNFQSKNVRQIKLIGNEIVLYQTRKWQQ